MINKNVFTSRILDVVMIHSDTKTFQFFTESDLVFLYANFQPCHRKIRLPFACPTNHHFDLNAHRTPLQTIATMRNASPMA